MLDRIYKLEPNARSICDTNGCIRSYSSKIPELGMILGQKIERNVYVNQQNFVSDIQLLNINFFCLFFMNY